MSHFFFYSRVSTLGQNTARQIESFKLHPFFDSKNLFVDKVQGNIPFFKRAEAVRLFEVISNFKGHSVTVVIDSIDRLGRNLLDILSTIEIFNANSINLKSLKEGFETLLDGKENPTAKMVISVMGSIAEMERNKIKERQTEGVLIAKAQGKFKGRKVGSTISNQQFISRYPLVVQKLKKGLSIRDIANITSISTTTILKLKKMLE